MQESDYILACNIKSCRSIKTQINEMVLDCPILEAQAEEARRYIYAIEVDLMAGLVIDSTQE